MHWLLKIRGGLLQRDSDAKLKGSPAVAVAGTIALAAAASVAAASTRGLAQARSGNASRG